MKPSIVAIGNTGARFLRTRTLRKRSGNEGQWRRPSATSNPETPRHWPWMAGSASNSITSGEIRRPPNAELCYIAERQGVLLAVDHTFLFTGAVHEMKALIDEGAIGHIYSFDSRRLGTLVTSKRESSKPVRAPCGGLQKRQRYQAALGLCRPRRRKRVGTHRAWSALQRTARGELRP